MYGLLLDLGPLGPFEKALPGLGKMPVFIGLGGKELLLLLQHTSRCQGQFRDPAFRCFPGRVFFGKPRPLAVEAPILWPPGGLLF